MFMTTCWLPMWLTRCQGRENGELLPPWHPELNGVGLSPSLVTDRLDATVGSSTWRISQVESQRVVYELSGSDGSRINLS